MVKTIRTPEQLIDALGGPTAVGDWAGITPGAVGNWAERGIPPGWHLRLLVEIKRRRLRYDPALFGLSSEQADILLRPDRVAQAS